MTDEGIFIIFVIKFALAIGSDEPMYVKYFTILRIVWGPYKEIENKKKKTFGYWVIMGLRKPAGNSISSD